MKRNATKPEKLAYINKWRHDNQARVMYNNARLRARDREQEFTITLEDVVIPPVCPVFGTPLQQEHRGCGVFDNSPSLDRIDNAKGYIPGNVAVISGKANVLKGKASLAELKAIVAWLENLPLDKPA